MCGLFYWERRGQDRFGVGGTREVSTPYSPWHRLSFRPDRDIESRPCPAETFCLSTELQSSPRRGASALRGVAHEGQGALLSSHYRRRDRLSRCDSDSCRE